MYYKCAKRSVDVDTYNCRICNLGRLPCHIGCGWWSSHPWKPFASLIVCDNIQSRIAVTVFLYTNTKEHGN